jgi:flagellar motor switch protein FliM
MSAESSEALLRIAVEAGGRARRALSLLDRERRDLESALRRAIPFLARRNVEIRCGAAQVQPLAELRAALGAPVHLIELVAQPGGSRGALLFDGGAAALILDGVLGGDGRSLPELDPQGLTGAQAAVLARISEQILTTFSEVLSIRAGLRLQKLAGHAVEALGETPPVVLVLEMGPAEAPSPARVALALAKDALAGELTKMPTNADKDAIDARIGQSMMEAPLELVAELARIQLKLEDVLSLKVGDTLDVGLHVEGLVSVRAGDRVVFRGTPTRAGGQLAIHIEERHEL